MAVVAGNKGWRVKWKMNKEKQKKNPLSHVGGINSHASVGEAKEHEGNDRIDLVAGGCILMKRKLYFNFHYF